MTDETLPVDLSPSPKGVPIPDKKGSNVVKFEGKGAPALPPPPDPFSQQDANNLIIMVERAPLQNLAEGRNVMASVNRFIQLCNSLNLPA